MSDRPSEPSPENEIDEAEIDITVETDEIHETVEEIKLEPIRTVVRELTRPDGSTVSVEVPVYAPFKLKGSAEDASKKPAANGKRALLK